MERVSAMTSYPNSSAIDEIIAFVKSRQILAAPFQKQLAPTDALVVFSLTNVDAFRDPAYPEARIESRCWNDILKLNGSALSLRIAHDEEFKTAVWPCLEVLSRSLWP